MTALTQPVAEERMSAKVVESTAPSAEVRSIRPFDDEEQRIFLERVALNKAGNLGDVVSGQ